MCPVDVVATQLEAGPPLPGKVAENRLWSLDALRLFAMACVVLRHAMSICGEEVVALPRFVGLGVFAALGGYLALRSRDPSWEGWLGRRLCRFYVPYWLLLAALFLANAFVGYKPTSWGLALSQVAGTAIFTHPGQLVGVHTWYVSLLVTTTFLAAAARRWPITLPASLAIVAVTVAAPTSVFHHCLLAFLVGASCARYCPGAAGCALAAAACALLGVFTHPGFLYPAAGCAALALALVLPRRSVAWLSGPGGATYEFFLVHGPIFLGLHQLVGLRLAGVLLAGTALSVVGTVALRWVAALLARQAWGALRGWEARSGPVRGGVLVGKK